MFNVKFKKKRKIIIGCTCPFPRKPEDWSLLMWMEFKKHMRTFEKCKDCREIVPERFIN